MSKTLTGTSSAHSPSSQPICENHITRLLREAERKRENLGVPVAITEVAMQLPELTSI